MGHGRAFAGSVAGGTSQVVEPLHGEVGPDDVRMVTMGMLMLEGAEVDAVTGIADVDAALL